MTKAKRDGQTDQTNPPRPRERSVEDRARDEPQRRQEEQERLNPASQQQNQREEERR